MRADDEARMALGTPEQAAAVRRAYDLYKDTVLHRAERQVIDTAMRYYHDALNALPPLPA
jgi:hypothetical protein